MMPSFVQYKRRRAAGLCTICEAPTDKAQCSDCSAVSRVKAKDRRERRQKAGMCPNCGVRKPWKHGTRCKVCVAAKRRETRNRRQYRRDNGLCVSCGDPAGDTVHCRGCLDRKLEQYHSQKAQVFDHYGRKCVCCGETREYFLQIDHVNDDGYLHRKEIGPTNLYRWAIRNGFPDTLQTLCANCNFGKKMNNGVCPCQSDSEPHS